MRRLKLGSLLQISSVVMKTGWLSCFAWICMMSLLVCLRTEFSQQCLTSVVKGRLRNVFIFCPHSQLVKWETFPTAITYMWMHTHITDPHEQCFTLLSSTFSSHATKAHRCTPILTLNPSPPPANKIRRMKTVRWSFPLWHRGSLGNIQTALPQAMKSNRSSLQS